VHLGDGAAAHARSAHHGVRLLIFSFRRKTRRGEAYD
jgi:hypothetical protein